MIRPAGEAGVSVRRQCELLGLNRSSTQYNSKKTPERDTALRAEIEAIVLEQPGYGYRRVTHELHRRQQRVNHKRVRRIMRRYSLHCRAGRRKTRAPGLPATNIPNVLRDEQIIPTAPNQVWHADLTYVHVLTGFVYLACVLDGYSRKVVGWALAKRADTRLVCDALDLALQARGDVAGLIHHSDQGSQYQSAAYLARLDAAGIRKSMSRKGTPGDNAKMESCMRTVKVEEVHLNHYEDEQDARQNLKRFLEDVYNEKRLHSSLGYRPPSEFEALYAQQQNPPCPLA